MPEALASASAVPEVTVLAASSIEPPAVSDRPVSARVSMSMTLIAMTAPTATPSPAAFASPVVVVEPVCWARTAIEPVTSHAPSVEVPIRAMVLCCTTAIATAGLTAVPPAEPAVTVVRTMSDEIASTSTSWPPVTIAPSSISALVTLSRTGLMATEAPMPTLAPVLSPASAFAVAVSSRRFSARSTRSPVPTETTALDGMTAWVVVVTTLSANEPATLTSVEPAPEDAAAVKVCTRSPSTSVMVASARKPSASTVVPSPSPARLTRFTRVSATAAPIPALEACTAVPSAVEIPSTFWLDRSTTPPPALRVRPSGSSAIAETSAIVSAIAAATETSPSELFASGLAELLTPLPPLLWLVVLAKLR